MVLSARNRLSVSAKLGKSFGKLCPSETAEHQRAPVECERDASGSAAEPAWAAMLPPDVTQFLGGVDWGHVLNQ